MHPPKSKRHQRAANARWRRAEAEREAGIPDEPIWSDTRQPFDLLLRHAGGRDLRIEPRLGYVSWRARDMQTGEVVHCCALKELLHRIADSLPRTIAARNFR